MAAAEAPVAAPTVRDGQEGQFIIELGLHKATKDVPDAAGAEAAAAKAFVHNVCPSVLPVAASEGLCQCK